MRGYNYYNSSAWDDGIIPGVDNRYFVGGCVLAVLAGLSVLAFAWFHTTPVKVKVAGHSWVWKIEVLRFKPVRYEREFGYPPSGAYNTHTWTESDAVYDSKGRLSGYDDTTYSNYTMDEWAHERWLAKGSKDKEPSWPSTKSINVKPPNKPLTRHGKWERQGRKVQEYFLELFEVGGEKPLRTWHYKTNPQLWLKIRSGTEHRVHVNHLGAIRSFEKLPQGDIPPE